MSSYSRALVHQLIASHLQVDSTSIHDGDAFRELELDPLDVVLIVLRLEAFDRGDGNFPLAALDQARTVGDLVALVDLWLETGRMLRRCRAMTGFTIVANDTRAATGTLDPSSSHSCQRVGGSRGGE